MGIIIKNLFRIVLLLIVLYGTIHKLCTAETCREPANLKEMLSSHVHDERSTNIIRNSLYWNVPEGILSIYNSRKGKVEKNYIPNETKQCPSQTGRGILVSVHTRSTCPWYYYSETDHWRYPKNIMQAKCRCENGCLGMASNHTHYHCEEVDVIVKVLYRLNNICDPVTKAYKYVKSYTKVSTGCTCAHKRTKWVQG